MVKYLPFLLLFVPATVLADPGVVCQSTDAEHSVRGCNCPGTCVGKFLMEASSVGGCETKVPCGEKAGPIKAEKEEEPPPYPVKLTVKTFKGVKLYSELLFSSFLSATSDLYGPLNKERCVKWADVDLHDHLICAKDNLIFHYEEVSYAEGKK